MAVRISLKCIESSGIFFSLPLKIRVLSYKGRTVDAWGQEADEGRGKQRNASGSGNHAMIRRYPNGVTQ